MPFSLYDKRVDQWLILEGGVFYETVDPQPVSFDNDFLQHLSRAICSRPATVLRKYNSNPIGPLDRYVVCDENYYFNRVVSVNNLFSLRVDRVSQPVREERLYFGVTPNGRVQRCDFDGVEGMLSPLILSMPARNVLLSCEGTETEENVEQALIRIVSELGWYNARFEIIPSNTPSTESLTDFLVLGGSNQSTDAMDVIARVRALTDSPIHGNSHANAVIFPHIWQEVCDLIAAGIAGGQE